VSAGYRRGIALSLAAAGVALGLGAGAVLARQLFGAQDPLPSYKGAPRILIRLNHQRAGDTLRLLHPTEVRAYATFDGELKSSWRCPAVSWRCERDGMVIYASGGHITSECRELDPERRFEWAVAGDFGKLVTEPCTVYLKLEPRSGKAPLEGRAAIEFVRGGW
jgi:hypothetical protein